MKTYKYILITIFTLLLFSCEEETEVLDFQSNIPTSFSLSKKSDTFGASSTAAQTYSLEVQTTSPHNADVTFTLELTSDEDLADPTDPNYNQSPNDYNFPATIILPAGQLTSSVDVVFNYDVLTYAPKHLVLDLGVPEDLIKNTSRQSIDIKYAKICILNSVDLSIDFDNWAEETSWEILDSNNSIVASNSYGQSDRDTSVSEEICLNDGSYTLNFKDVYGDGMSYGAYVLSFNGNTLASGTGNFGFTQSTSFSLP